MDKKVVYLAGPVTHTRWVEVVEWRSLATNKIKEMGMGVLNPVRHGIKNDGEITKLCKSDIEACDVMLVNLLGQKRENLSMGTIIELGWADAFGKPMIVIIEDGADFDYGILSEITPVRGKSIGEGLFLLNNHV